MQGSSSYRQGRPLSGSGAVARRRALYGLALGLLCLLPPAVDAQESTDAPSPQLPDEETVTREIVAEEIGPGIVRFHASQEALAGRLPSLALQRPRPAFGPAPEAFPVWPDFRNVQGRHAAWIDIDAGTSLYGTGEVAGPLLRNGHRTTAWNFDAYGYDERTPHLYQSHPWVLAVRSDGTSYGVLADTSHRCHIDLTGGILFVADGPAFAVIVIERARPQEVVQALADLIGPSPLPPLWALGYHQCRYSYTPDRRVREVASEFRRRNLPCDVIWLDIDYMDEYRSFTFSPVEFPDPVALMQDLHGMDFHTVAIIDPGIKLDPGYFIYDSGTAINAWVKTRLGDVYIGTVWPGDCVFPDFTQRKVRSWWAGLYGEFLGAGIDGVWNDMNEPAIFNVDSKTMPLDNIHMADPELGGTGRHARYHNVYGMLMARATREGMLQARPNRRPFVLSRANFLGGQRYAAAWTGDNTASWRHLDISIPMVLNLGLSGQPFSGPDIGGFAGAGDGRMFARWMGFGALLPFARGHTGKGNIDKEPWAFGAEVERTCRRALVQRYLLLPYLYTLFREASRTGMPVARPLFFADPVDPDLRAEDDAFLLGSDLLVACQVTARGERQVAMPQQVWLPLEPLDGDSRDPELPSLFIRGGSVVPTARFVQPVAAVVPPDTLLLLVCLDEEGFAEGILYEDAGDGFGEREGRYRLVHYTVRRTADSIRVEASKKAGDWDLPEYPLQVRLVRHGRDIKIGTGLTATGGTFALPRP
jgi:alpha-glucosidase